MLAHGKSYKHMCVRSLSATAIHLAIQPHIEIINAIKRNLSVDIYCSKIKER